MNTEELLKRVHRIEIKTRALTQNMFAGEYHSAFKGRGMSFAEVREYQPGDDVRDIEWNVTARTNRPHLKEYEEERELTVMLLVDVSRSLVFGSRGSSERELMVEIAASLAFSADQNNDKIGVLFFSDKVEKFIPPQKGRKHVLYIIRELLNFEASSRGTDIGVGLMYLMHVVPRRCVAFLVSDFIDVHDYEVPLQIASRKHDMVAVHLYDELQRQLPRVGLVLTEDAETGKKRYVDTHDKEFQAYYEQEWATRYAAWKDLMRRCHVDAVEVATGGDYSKALLQLFRQRY